MFIDGLIYATISHNMANDIGNFWNPEIINFHVFHYLNGPIFYEHPPLMFYLESLFFRILGDGFIVERIFCSVILLAHVLLILLIFKLFFPRNNFLLFGWIPVLLWYTFPELIQKLPANLLDSAMSVFDLLAVYFILLGYHKRKFFYALFGGLFIYLAFITKGPIGLFPLIIPIIYHFVFKHQTRLRQTILNQVIVFFSLVLIFSLVLFNEEAKQFLTTYFNNQVIASVAGEREKADTFYNHFSLFVKLLKQLSPLLTIMLISFLLNIKYKIFNKNLKFKNALFFIIIGLSGSLPIALSSKHHSFYLIPSFPYYALCFAVFISDNLNASEVKRMIPNLGILKAIQYILLIGLISLMVYAGSIYGKINPRHTILVDLMEYKDQVPKQSEIGVCKKYYNDGKFSTYHERYLLAKTKNGYYNVEYAVVNYNCETDSLTFTNEMGFEKVSDETSQFHLYRKRE